MTRFRRVAIRVQEAMHARASLKATILHLVALSLILQAACHMTTTCALLITRVDALRDAMALALTLALLPIKLPRT